MTKITTQNFPRVVALLVLLKWGTLLGSLALAYFYNAWAEFGICFLMLYGNNLDWRIRRLRRVYNIVRETLDEKKTFDEKADKSFK